MAAPEVSNPFEDDQEPPVVEPPFKKPCVHSASSGLESSNGGSIYNALRATSSNGDETTPGDQIGSSTVERVDTRMAANIAMFCSASSIRAQCCQSGGSAPNPPSSNTDEIGRPPGAHLMADNIRLAWTEEVKAWSLPDGLSDFDDVQRCSLADRSNNAGDKSAIVASPSPKWPGNIKSPASPTLPEYPPPIRSPTPPGLPSFGSEEARLYDFRIGAQHPIPNRSESLLRRLFQRVSPSPSPPHNNRQPRSRVFAEDGTAVLGSFPHRPSSHGTNGLRKIDDHPFHQGNLPLAQSGSASTQGNDAVSEEPGHSDVCPPPDSGADEATLRWLSSGTPSALVPQLPTPHNSLLSPGSPGRVDSYYTCVSRLQDPNTLSRILRQSHSILPEPCYLAPTQSAVPTNPQDTDTSQINSHDIDLPDFWKLLVKRATSIFYSCCGPEVSETLNPPGVLNQNTTNTTNLTTQDTYVTAREQVSNESQQPQPTIATEIHPGP